MNNELIRIYRKLSYWRNLLNLQLPQDFKDKITSNLTELEQIIKESWKSENFSSEVQSQILNLEQKLNCLSEDSRKISC